MSVLSKGGEKEVLFKLNRESKEGRIYKTGSISGRIYKHIKHSLDKDPSSLVMKNEL